MSGAAIRRYKLEKIRKTTQRVTNEQSETRKVQSVGLMTLPTEILVTIARKLTSFKDLACLSRTCTRLWTVARMLPRPAMVVKNKNGHFQLVKDDDGKCTKTFVYGLNKEKRDEVNRLGDLRGVDHLTVESSEFCVEPSETIKCTRTKLTSFVGCCFDFGPQPTRISCELTFSRSEVLWMLWGGGHKVTEFERVLDCTGTVGNGNRYLSILESSLDFKAAITVWPCPTRDVECRELDVRTWRVSEKRTYFADNFRYIFRFFPHEIIFVCRGEIIHTVSIADSGDFNALKTKKPWEVTKFGPAILVDSIWAKFEKTFAGRGMRICYLKREELRDKIRVTIKVETRNG